MSITPKELREFWRDGFDVGDVAGVCNRSTDRIEELEAALERAAGVIHGLNANIQPNTINGEELLIARVLGKR